jgi:hypothetical protein
MASAGAVSCAPRGPIGPGGYVTLAAAHANEPEPGRARTNPTRAAGLANPIRAIRTNPQPPGVLGAVGSRGRANLRQVTSRQPTGLWYGDRGQQECGDAVLQLRDRDREGA